MGIIFDKPLIGVVMCQTHHHGHPVQSVHNKYLDAVVTMPLLPPVACRLRCLISLWLPLIYQKTLWLCWTEFY